MRRKATAREDIYQLKRTFCGNSVGWLSNCCLLAACDDQADGSAIVFRDPESQVRFVVIRREIHIAIAECITPAKIERFYMVAGLLQALDHRLDIAPAKDRNITILQRGPI